MVNASSVGSTFMNGSPDAATTVSTGTLTGELSHSGEATVMESACVPGARPVASAVRTVQLQSESAVPVRGLADTLVPGVTDHVIVPSPAFLMPKYLATEPVSPW